MELSQWISLISGVSLLVLGIVNTVLMFETLGRSGVNGSLRSLHVRLGWVFVFTVVIFFIFMIPRIEHADTFSSLVTCHAVLGIILLPLVVWKLLIAGRYKTYMRVLPALGFTIMVITFTAVILTCGRLIAAGLSHEHLSH